MNQRMKDNVVILTPKGFVIGGLELKLLEEGLDFFLTSQQRQFAIVNLSQTEHLGPPAVTLLSDARQNSMRVGKRLVICAMSVGLKKSVAKAKLSQLFDPDIYTNEKDAIAACTVTQPQ